ncbi:hypothetical protein [Pelagibacterium sp. H642]|uniref:hypothetical protein n=1 Tax=Pelagibacterium sp. H642 TaxID=1881069 RepID=UPI0028150453|nr:hypothetical protein [Pelagibacterium sp. H642]WMT90054.1 hypothetical protein NO934_14820 [Pelagibacterium sp. H642]
MRAILAAIAATSLLSACSTVNHSTGSLQFNFDAEPLPENHLELAADAVQGRETDGPLQVSQPRTMIGETPFAPQRWYVCIRGIKAKGTPDESGTIQSKVEDLFAPRAASGIYDVVVMLRGNERPAVLEGYDSRLCRDAAFPPLRA